MRQLVLALAAVAASSTALAATSTQSDWSGGPAGGTPNTTWTNRFAAATGISWLAVPGQIALASEPLDDAVKESIDGEFATAASVVVADVDGDGTLDVVAAALGAGEIAWWPNDGTGVWRRRVVAGGLKEPICVHAADLDGDGDTDLLGALFGEGRFTAWYNDGGDPIQWREQDVGAGFGRPHWVSTADVDGDGVLDVVGAAAGTSDIVWWRQMPGDPTTWTEQLVDGQFGGARAVEGVDVDGDGDTDLVGVALLANEVAWWSNDGGDPIAWTRLTVSDSFGGAHGLTVRDLDLDGDPDLLAAGYTGNDVSWWSNDGGLPVTWTEQRIDDLFGGALTVDAADVDGDGDLDVVGAGDIFDQVAWWSNGGGDPIAWTRSAIDARFVGAWPVTTADLDRDGDVDVVAAADQSGEVAWWRVTRFSSAGTLVTEVLDTGTGLEDGRCGWDARVPAGTALTVAARASDDASNLGPWSLITPGPLPAALQGRRFLQLRFTLESDHPDASPVVEHVSCGWGLEPPRASGGRIAS